MGNDKISVMSMIFDHCIYLHWFNFFSSMQFQDFFMNQQMDF